MFRYTKKTTKLFVTLSSIAIFSSIIEEGTARAEELNSDSTNSIIVKIDKDQNSNIGDESEEVITIKDFYEGDSHLIGQTIFTDKKVRVMGENGTVLYKSETDSEGRFNLEVTNLVAGDYIKIEIYEEIEQKFDKSIEIDQYLTKKPSEEITKGSGEEFVEESFEETTEESTEKFVEGLSEEATKESGEEFVEEPFEETTEEPVEEFVEESFKETTEESTEEFVEEPSEEATGESTEEVVEQKILAIKEIYVKKAVINDSPNFENEEKKEANTESKEKPKNEDRDKIKVSSKKPVTPVKKETNKVSNKSEIQTFAIKKSDPLGKTYHYVRSGDTLLKIASGYGTSVAKLSEWNNLKSSSLIYPGQILSVDGTNNYNSISKETKSFNNTQEFISFLAPHAKRIAREKNLYASVMLAQAIHESAHGKSGLAVSGNNLFGIKGSYNGNSINMLTWEEINGEVVWVVDSFRLYPSFADSLNDNGDLLRNGLYWNPGFYSGAWVENTKSYRDATEWLTGRYATDSLYASKLNNTISYYNLTAYDEHINGSNPVTSEKNLNLKVVLTGKDYTIFKQPKGTLDGVSIGSAEIYRNKLVTVDKEKVNDLGKWWHVSFNGKPVGYVLSSAFTEFSEPIISEKSVEYIGTVTENYIISARPWRTEGASQLSSGKKYYNQPLKIIKEARTAKFNYVLLADKNGKSIGWIDKAATIQVNEVISNKKVNYAGIVVPSTIITTKLPYTSGAVPIKNYKWYHNRSVEIIEETKTVWGEFSLIKFANKTVGWIEKAAINQYQVLSTTDVDYQAFIAEGWSINTQPWGVEGYQVIPNYKSYKGKLVDVKKEKITHKGTFSLIFLNGKELGWIDKGALDTYYRVLSTTDTNYAASVIKPWSINTQPWGTYNSNNVASGKKYLGKNVMVTQEKVTERGAYSLITIDGKKVGWIDKSGLNEITILSDKAANYYAKLIKPWSINTKPWGVNDFKHVESGKYHLQKNVHVIREQTTARSTYALISIDGKKLGWIDKDALNMYHNVQSTTDVSYSAVIRKPWSINTAPWGTMNSKLITSAKNYLGKKVEVKQEKVTSRSTYVLVYIDGKELGWIDKTGITI